MAKVKYGNDSHTLKRFLIILSMIIGIIFLGLYFYKWHQVKSEEEYLKSYLVSTNTISLEMNDINEIKAVLSETPSDYFVYISYTKDKNIYSLEKDLKPLIDKYNINNNFYYIDVTNIKETNHNYKKDIAKALNIKSEQIEKVPAILYFKDGILIQDGIYTSQDFEKLLEEQDVE